VTVQVGDVAVRPSLGAVRDGGDVVLVPAGGHPQLGVEKAWRTRLTSCAGIPRVARPSMIQRG
jgi:hypothetical protein